MSNSNIILAIHDMRAHLDELSAEVLAADRIREIYSDASACYDLMNYSYEVADTRHAQWVELDLLVNQVLIQCSELLKG